LAQAAQAQSNATTTGRPVVETQSAQVSGELIEPPQSPGLPDMPLPQPLIPQDGPAPCPAGVGEPCALLGGRLYFKDPGHMTEHNATWGQAMKNPFLIGGEILNLAATIADVEETEACLHAHTCKEQNPILGSKPSRARAYGTAIPLDFAVYAMAGLLKKQGKGNYAFGTLWILTATHIYFAAEGRALASGVSSGPPNTNGSHQMGISIGF